MLACNHELGMERHNYIILWNGACETDEFSKYFTVVALFIMMTLIGCSSKLDRGIIRAFPT